MSDEVKPDFDDPGAERTSPPESHSDNALADFTDRLLSGNEEDDLDLADDQELRDLQETVVLLRRVLRGGPPDRRRISQMQSKLNREYRQSYSSPLEPFWRRWLRPLLPAPTQWRSNRARRRNFALGLAVAVFVPLLISLLLFQYSGANIWGTVFKPGEPYPGPGGAGTLAFAYGRPGLTARLSVNADGEEGNHNSWASAISADGTLVVFVSLADNLLPTGDDNGASDIFLYNRQTRQLTRVSQGLESQMANGDSFNPVISADGRFIAFSSLASNLVAGDNNEVADIFVYDRESAVIERVSQGLNGQEGNGASRTPAISGDGRYVVFRSLAANLVAGDTNDKSDIFLYDRQSGAVERVSVSSTGEQANGDSQSPAISANGRFIAYSSLASNLVAADTNNFEDLFIYDRDSAVTQRVTAAGQQGNNHSYGASLSADGRYLAFLSHADNLVADDSNNKSDVFIYDWQTTAVQRLSVDSGGQQANNNSGNPVISANGRVVAFPSFATNLAPDTVFGYMGIYIHDRQNGRTERVSYARDGQEGNGASVNPTLSADGRYVVFDSVASNLVFNDTNNRVDIFLRDRDPRMQISLNQAVGQPGSLFVLSGSGMAPHDQVVISVNGRDLGDAATGADGSLDATLATTNADLGFYILTVQAGMSRSSASFYLQTGLVQTTAATGPVFEIPPGIAFANFLYLPVLGR
jgi:Tol biopolymer transport system component